jgi:hypothetical protein
VRGERVRAEGLSGLNLKAALDYLYSQEINVSIESFWDAGWTIALGDRANGFVDGVYVECEDLDEGMQRFLKLFHKWKSND